MSKVNFSLFSRYVVRNLTSVFKPNHLRVSSYKQSIHCQFVVVRNGSAYSRTPVRVFYPKRGEIIGKETLSKLPPEPKEDLLLNEKLKTSGDVFRKVMGDIHTSRNKFQIAIEGARLVEEAVNVGLEMQMLFLLKSLSKYPTALHKIVQEHEAFTRVNESNSLHKFKPEVHRINLKTLQTWSSVTTSPGIIGIFKKPSETFKLELTNTSQNNVRAQNRLTVVLDNIREPGNLGSVLRTSAGIGCNVLLSEGCVNPWDMKTIRGGHGAQFYVPLKTNVDNFHQALLQYVLFLEQATCSSETNYSEINDSNNNVNVDHSPSRSGIGIFLADSGLDVDSYGIPLTSYTSIQYSQFEYVILFLGGETTGLSEKSRKAVVELQKMYPNQIKCVTRVNVPMALPIDSLNVANTFGIIGYEILRQCNLYTS